jgi:hypothetical protein
MKFPREWRRPERVFVERKPDDGGLRRTGGKAMPRRETETTQPNAAHAQQVAAGQGRFVKVHCSHLTGSRAPVACVRLAGELEYVPTDGWGRCLHKAPSSDIIDPSRLFYCRARR